MSETLTRAGSRISKGGGVSALRACLLSISGDEERPLLEPLPVTRDLGQRFGVSNVSAFRVLAELRERGLLWQADNGRYYRPAARRLIEKPKPVACLLRQLQAWSEVGREILQGADEACGTMDRAILLVHDRALYQQANPTSPTTTASKEILAECLEDFLLLHGERTSGILLDELWPDDVLTAFRQRLRNAVVLYRSTRLKWAGNVLPDLDAAAGIVLDRAAASECDALRILHPAFSYEPAEQMAEAILRRAKTAGIKATRTPFPMRGLESTVRAGVKAKELWVATEDNLACAIRDAFTRFPAASPPLLSTMGSPIAIQNGIPCVSIDYRQLGHEAARMAISGQPARLRIKPVFVSAGSRAFPALNPTSSP